MKKVIKEYIYGFEMLDILSGHSIDEVIESLQEIREDNLEYFDTEFVVTRSYTDVTIELYGFRDETDAEYAVRVEKEKQQDEIRLKKLADQKTKHTQKLAQIEAQERDTLKRLKEKYETNSK